jgi:hypothetical protein
MRRADRPDHGEPELARINHGERWPPHSNSAVSRCASAGVHGLEDAKVAVELVLGRVVTNRPTGADRDRTRPDSIDDAIRATQELDEIIDQLRIAEVNRRHCRRCGRDAPSGRLSHSQQAPTPVKANQA